MDRSVNRLVLYTRSGGHRPPRDHERLEVFENGAFEMRRSVGAASTPVSPVGLFQGQVPAGFFNELEGLVSAAGKAGSLNVVPVPDASIDSITIGAFQARMGRHDQPEGPWGQLVEALRTALGSLSNQVLAAISLEVSPQGTRARLQHLGSQPVQLDLSQLQVRAVLWQGFKKIGDWRPTSKPAGLPAKIEAASGWVFELPFTHGFDPEPGQEVAAYVVLTLFDGKKPVPVSLEARS
jgi:hypothetical protein